MNEKNKRILRQTWAEIDLKNLDYNIKWVRDKIGDKTTITGVVKADGYGHGVVEVAKILQKNNIKSFGVATLKEARKLRKKGFNEEIIMLGLLPDESAEDIVDYNITPIICDYNNILAISKEAVNKNKTVEIYIIVDTGMGRIGYLDCEEETLKEIMEIAKLPNIKIKGLISHMATAGEDETFARYQIEKYKEFYDKLESLGLNFPVKTLGNSGIALTMPEGYFDNVRVGIAMYGSTPSTEIEALPPLKQVMSVKARIVFIKKVPAGFSVGYGRTFVTERESLIATIPIGYADGYRRNCSNVGKVIVNGEFANIVGNICMDQCMVDVTDIKDVKLGDEVVIMGRMGDKEITAVDIAEVVGTINYEILCGFGQRLERKYIY